MPMDLTLHQRLSALPSTTRYFAKDLAKAIGATKFIGRGSEPSSTRRYCLAAGDLANCGTYSTNDVVFVSAEGARKGRLEVDFVELGLAVRAGAQFVTDNRADRHRPYNVGERRVEQYLLGAGYQEVRPGW